MIHFSELYLREAFLILKDIHELSSVSFWFPGYRTLELQSGFWVTCLQEGRHSLPSMFEQLRKGICDEHTHSVALSSLFTVIPMCCTRKECIWVPLKGREFRWDVVNQNAAPALLRGDCDGHEGSEQELWGLRLVVTSLLRSGVAGDDGSVCGWQNGIFIALDSREAPGPYVRLWVYCSLLGLRVWFSWSLLSFWFFFEVTSLDADLAIY